MHRDAVKEKIAAAKQFLRVYHREHPLAAGCNKEELRSRVLPKAPPPVFEQILSLDEEFVISGEFTRLNSHKITMQAEEQDASARMEAAFAGAGLQVPSLAEVLNSSGVDPSRARTLLQLLLKERRLIKVSEDLVFHASALENIGAMLSQHKGARFSVAEFKEWTGVSRKYAIPLLEWLDRERLTRRDGDSRVVL